MKISLITLGNKMPTWVESGFNEYQKRLKPTIDLQLKELALIKRTKNSDSQRILQQEHTQLCSQLRPNSHNIALDSRGAQYTSEDLAQQLAHWQQLAKPINIIIGGPEGYHPDTLSHTQEQWSLSKLTFPHPLVRIILAEQIYRAQCILQKHPYHK